MVQPLETCLGLISAIVSLVLPQDLVKIFNETGIMVLQSQAHRPVFQLDSHEGV